MMGIGFFSRTSKHGRTVVPEVEDNNQKIRRYHDYPAHPAYDAPNGGGLWPHRERFNGLDYEWGRYALDERWFIGVREDYCARRGDYAQLKENLTKEVIREAYNMAVKYGCRIGKGRTNIVGLLLSEGIPPREVFNIYEGENTVKENRYPDEYGRGNITITYIAPTVYAEDIMAPESHIYVRSEQGKFKFKANGIRINGVLTDEGELHSHDVIRIGSTNLIFMAIPQSD
ncbi:MAG: hypothetical protein LBT78_11115 [Tannerella sp.]|jgi:hypothetical protein|nr:hypothetical protein [Tannerella sp.]